MAPSVNERLGRLERRVRPPYEPNPHMDLLLKLMNNARAELDGEGEPEPLTLADRRELLVDSEHFLEYLDGQRRLDRSPEAAAELDEWERRTLEDMEVLRTEIETLERGAS